jgi:excisionase family DNA binding protein
VNVRQAAARLEVSPSTVYALIAAGKLRCVRVGPKGGAIRVSEEHLAEYLRAAEPRTAAPASAPLLHLKHLRLASPTRAGGHADA